MFNKLRTRLTLISIVLTLVPVLFISITLGSRSFTDSVNNSLERQRLLSNRVSQAIQDTFSQRVNELTVLGNSAQLEQLPPAEVQGLLANLMHNQAYDSIIIVSPHGEAQSEAALFNTVTTADLTNQWDNAAFQAARTTGKVSYSDVYFSQQTGEPLLTIALPFYDLQTGDLSSVILANFRFHLIWDLVANLETPDRPGLQIFLTNASGTVIAHANPTIVFQRKVFNVPSQDGQAVGLDGVQALITHQSLTLGNLTYTIVGEEPTATALQDAQSIAFTTAVIALATILVVGLVIFFGSRQIVQPIEQLSQVAESIRGGDLNAQAKVTRNDEIGRMAQAFNSMTAQLRQTLQGLQDHVQQLEKARVEREQLIKDLQGARRLAEENSRLKSEFLSTMSHELRTPLNAIEGFTGILLNKMSGTEYNSKTENFLTRIRSNSRRLLHLINDFLDLSRIEAGRLELANMPFSPRQLVKRWQDEIGVLAGEKGLQFDVQLDPSLPDTIYGDEEALSKVALNLLGNAIKFTEQGQVKLAMGRTDGQWDIAVEDTGIGIPPHASEFIFEEFRQVDQSSKRKYGGSGLGLAIVAKYTRAMGGNVQVKSELGKGSTFTVSLPLKTSV